MQKKVLAIAMIAMSSFAFVSCNKDDDQPAAPSSLYDRLGGKNAISAVVDQFITNVAADPKMKRTFQPLLDDVGKGNTARVTSLRNNLIDQIGQASGGPEKYMGKDMVTAHKGMKITDDEFNSLVADLVAALNKFSVPSKEQGELLSVLGGLKGQIVNQ
ncbi:group 1 truncated hemoglobin [Fibrisoma montanum]|uniref:Group 1 truncated hemoglobin n=1 Tax=Fibrisoma montanum TaxID=2305895 RepID=A0A418MI29_9BACT|nr:group 1 truncated hemoglobin [Fibrisoma montanum]RIV27080.1 group 1 truncated hemoglobin [Fibrisoma montanum]